MKLEEQGLKTKQSQGISKKLMIKIAISFCIFGLIFYFLPLSDLWRSMQRISYKLWFVTLAIYAFAHFLGTLKWMTLMRIGNVKLKVIDAVRCYFLGLFANLFLPSLVGGDILRAGMAMRFSRRKMGIICGSLVDRFIDVISLCILITVAGWFIHGDLDEKKQKILLFALAMFICTGLCGLIVLTFGPSKKLPIKIRYKVQRIRLACRKLIYQPFYALAGISISLTIQGSFVFVNSMLGKAIGIKVSQYIWFLTWPLAKIMAMLPVSFCGFGVREASLAVLMKPFGVQTSDAVAQSLIWETVIVAGSLLGGILYLVLGRKLAVREAWIVIRRNFLSGFRKFKKVWINYEKT